MEKIVQNKKKMGRPTKFCKALAEEICSKLAVSSTSIDKLISANENWPVQSTIYKWLQEQPNFSEKFKIAKELQCEALENSVLDIAFNEDNDFYFNGKLTVANSTKVARDSLKLNAIQKILSWRNKAKYGTNAQIEVKGNIMTATGMTTTELKNHARSLIKECSKKKD